MTMVKIKHAQFLYYVESPVPGDKPALGRRIAMRNEIVDIPRDEDLERGKAADALVETSQLTDDNEAAEEDAASESPPAEGLNFDSQDELVIWLQENKPTVPQTIAAADGNADKAEALMDAEEEASGGQPRKSVMEGLQKILDAAED